MVSHAEELKAFERFCQMTIRQSLSKECGNEVQIAWGATRLLRLSMAWGYGGQNIPVSCNMSLSCYWYLSG